MIGGGGARLERMGAGVAAPLPSCPRLASMRPGIVLCSVRARLLILTAMLFGLVAATVAGCGDSSGTGIASKAPVEIVTASKAAADGASSVHVAGSISNAGTSIALDMDLQAGKGGRGRISESGLSFEVIELGGYVYITGSPSFYDHFAGSAAARTLRGKWLKAPATNRGFASLDSLTNLRKLVDSSLDTHGPLAKLATRTVAGRQAVGVRDVTRGGVLYVATTGTPFPVAITKADGGGKIVFSRWNAPLRLVAPKHAVDLQQLEAGG
jgi:hypothetical protein